jgi:Rrf2 family protein
VQATLLLAKAKGEAPVPCSQLAAAGKMPERFLLQILRHLVTHGILHSTRGVDGGYSLERAPDQISLLDVIEALEGPLGGATSESDLPAGVDVKLRQALERVTTTSRRELEAIKLSDLLAGSMPIRES